MQTAMGSNIMVFLKGKSEGCIDPLQLLNTPCMRKFVSHTWTNIAFGYSYEEDELYVMLLLHFETDII